MAFNHLGCAFGREHSPLGAGACVNTAHRWTGLFPTRRTPFALSIFNHCCRWRRHTLSPYLW